ncbi:MAG: hypothetical protein ACD_15C00137G0006 [uncultured bacterium]|nr:MAG: hypothetical protein ACD_15C00137G0006 [uncultured bacterium]
MKINYQKIYSHRSYTKKELSGLLGVTEKTCSRWIESGLKIIEGSKKPILILGKEAKNFFVNKKLKGSIKLNRYQFLCMTCKKASDAKRGSIMTIGNRKTALCRVCNGKMSRTIKPHQKDYMIHSPPTQMSIFDIN